MIAVEDRAELDVHVFWAPRRVMDMQDAVGPLQFERPFHWAVLSRLVTRHVVVVRHAVALVADVGLAGRAELPLVGRVRSQDAVLRIQHDHRLRIVLEKRDERLNLRRRPHVRLVRRRFASFLRARGSGH